ncbi:hypothetical protein Ddye_029850, partial [Dipteronia dyeriana]
MVVEKGKKTKVEEEIIKQIDSELVLYIEKLSEIQDELENINEEASDKVLEEEQKYSEDTKLTKTFTFLDDEGTMKITTTSIKWKEGIGLSNGVNHEKKGNKRPFADENGIHDEVAEIIKEDLWPNPLTYFNNEADEEEFEGEEGDEEGKEDDSPNDNEDDQTEDDDED